MKGRCLRSAAILLVPALVALAASVQARANVTITINDLGEGNPITTVSGFDPASLSTLLNPEAFDLHGEYLSNSFLAPGSVVVVNFSFTEPAFEVPPGGTAISDTLNIVFTGHTPTAGDPNNISVDLHFRSDSDPSGLPPLTNAVTLAETGAFQDLTAEIVLAGGPSDSSVSVASDVVPEPASMILLGTGLLGLAGSVRRRLKR